MSETFAKTPATTCVHGTSLFRLKLFHFIIGVRLDYIVKPEQQKAEDQNVERKRRQENVMNARRIRQLMTC